MRLLAVAAVLLSSCATSPEPSAAEPRTTYLVCGSTVRLDIRHDGQTAVVRSGNEQVVLKRVASTLGNRYEGGGISVTRSGDAYVYTAPDGSTLACSPMG